MGKLGPRLSSRKKAKRWQKGQSASSNPETTKHRQQARSRFFQENLGSTGLTTDVLKRHDALQGLERLDISDDDAASSSASTFKTFDTFASDYSNCSNLSFSRFLTHFQSSSAIHKEMLAILAAVTEVIKQNGGTESSTEYYAALMTTLEQADTEESVAAILSLLGMGLKTVPKNVLKLQFSQASGTFFQVLTKFATTDNFLILRHSIGCLSLLLRCQDPVIWSQPSTLQVLDGILSFTVHAKPKVRKASQHAICAILQGSDLMRTENPPVYHPAAPQVAKQCLQQLENAGHPGTITTTLHILTMLKDIAHQLPKNYVKSICEAFLRIMTLKNSLVTSCCLQTLHSLFISRPSESILPSQLNAQIINALYDYQPAPGDTQPTVAWLAVMQEAHSNLVNTNPSLCAANLPRIVETTCQLWLSDKTEVVSAASHTIKSFIQLCVAPLCENETLAQNYKATLSKIIQLIQGGLKYQFNSAWHHVLHLLAVLFQTAGSTCPKELSPVLLELAELRDSYKFTYNAEVEYAVGAAVKSMGPELVLAKIPLQTSAEGVDLKRSWLLPVLKDCINNSSLGYFVTHMLPLAIMCERKSNDLRQRNDGVGAHSYQLLNSQIWALLPAFCNNPRDIKDNFKDLAKILGMAISQKKDLRISVMASLRKLITKSQENNKLEDVETLSTYAKNYMPLLFNLYTIKGNGSDEEGQRRAAFDTIKVYLTITPEEITGELFDKALGKLEADCDDFTKQSVFDLIRIVTQFTDKTRLRSLYDKIVPILNEGKHPKEQKKAYRFLEEICGSQSPMCKSYVLENRKSIEKLLITATEKVCTTSKGARLRCISHLVESHPQLSKTKFFKAIIPEIVICIKDLNERCRTTAYQLLNIIADKFLEKADDFKNYIDMLVAGLAGAPIYISATLLALASLTYKYNGTVGVATLKDILGNTCVLITGPTREIALSALSYIKVYLSALPSAIIGPNLQVIMEGLVGMTDDCKRHFRQKVRDILVKLVRKFGTETISGLVPASDEVMHKRLNNIKKIEARKLKAREERKDKGEKDMNEDEREFDVKRMPKSVEEILADSDEEFDDVDMEVTAKSKKNTRKTWIKEGGDSIVDFADPSAAKNITATRPGAATSSKTPKGMSQGFKTAEDGRLIIKDSDDESEVEGEAKKRKKKLPFLGNNSEDDYQDDDDNADTKSMVSERVQRKRKISGSDASSVGTSRYQAGGRGIHRPVKTAKVERTPGAEFKAKNAPGDVKKKGKHDPYAYLPLTRASLNRRKKLKNAGKFKNIITGARKGAQAGKKGRKSK